MAGKGCGPMDKKAAGKKAPPKKAAKGKKPMAKPAPFVPGAGRGAFSKFS